VAIVPPSGSPQASIWGERGREAWPQDGSTVEYELATSFSTPDGSYHQASVARLVLVYDGDAWSGSCTGETTKVLDGVASTSSWSVASGGRPASAPADGRPGDEVLVSLLDDVDIAEGCRQRSEAVQVVRQQDDAFRGEEPAGTTEYQDITVTWHRSTGLVLEWSRVVHGGSAAGRLVATDAPGV